MGRREKLLGYLAEHLAEDEEVLDAMVGSYQYRSRPNPERGIFAATSRRLVFFASSRQGYDLESFPYENISSLEHGKKFTGGTLRFRLADTTGISTLIRPPFTTVAATMITSVPNLPSFADLIEDRMKEPSIGDRMEEPSPVAVEQPASLFELSESEPVVSGEFIMRRTTERRLLMKFDSGWELRRRAGSRKSVRYATLDGRWRDGRLKVEIGGSETWTLSMGDPMFCEMSDLSGRRIATCEWGKFLKLGESQAELRTNIIFPHGPNFELRIDADKSHQLSSWSEDLRFKGTLVADGSPGGFMKIHHPTPTAAVLLWWAVHRRKTIPYLPRETGGGGEYYGG